MKTGDKPAGRFGIPPLYFLLLAVPVAFLLRWRHGGELWIFIASCVAILPLAGLMGRATENLADSLGPALGGLLNATFGNAAELIIALLALHHGKVAIVKASITGSILGNILLVLGMAILAGGMRHSRQTFNRTAAGLGSTLMALAAVALLIPSVYYYLVESLPHERRPPQGLEYLSDEIAGILAVTYLASLFFTLRTHRHLLDDDAPPEQPEWSRSVSVLVLLIATIGVAAMSELLVESVEPAARQLGMSDIFVGVIVVAIIGNAAEHSTAILVALKNKMDLAVTIAVGSSLQVALFVAPLLVFAGIVMGQPMDLHFSPLEVVAVAIAVFAMALVAQDGESHWMEGVMLLAVYAILGLAFYHLPA
jgi:Ca2+:H+ antiporter